MMPNLKINHKCAFQIRYFKIEEFCLTPRLRLMISSPRNEGFNYKLNGYLLRLPGGDHNHTVLQPPKTHSHTFQFHKADLVNPLGSNPSPGKKRPIIPQWNRRTIWSGSSHQKHNNKKIMFRFQGTDNIQYWNVKDISLKMIPIRGISARLPINPRWHEHRSTITKKI